MSCCDQDASVHKQFLVASDLAGKSGDSIFEILNFSHNSGVARAKPLGWPNLDEQNFGVASHPNLSIF